MKAKEFDKIYKDLADSRLSLIQKKRNDYAGTNNVFSNFEETARELNITVDQVFIFWITIKRQRLANLLLNSKSPKNESVEDTLEDLANYVDLYNIWRRGINEKIYFKNKKKNEYFKIKKSITCRFNLYC